MFFIFRMGWTSIGVLSSFLIKALFPYLQQNRKSRKKISWKQSLTLVRKCSSPHPPLWRRAGLSLYDFHSHPRGSGSRMTHLTALQLWQWIRLWNCACLHYYVPNENLFSSCWFFAGNDDHFADKITVWLIVKNSGNKSRTTGWLAETEHRGGQLFTLTIWARYIFHFWKEM